MVYPVYNLKFKIGVPNGGNVVMTEIADLETFQIAIDGNVEEWTPLNSEGWARALMTGKKFTLTLNGKRNVGDVGNDFIANTAWKDGLDCTAPAEVEFPDGATLEFDAVIDVKSAGGGDSTSVGALEFDLISDGKPEYSGGLLPLLTITLTKGGTAGTKISSVSPALIGGNSYVYKINGGLPATGRKLVAGVGGWLVGDTVSDILAGAGNSLVLVEIDPNEKAVKGGQVAITSAVVKNAIS